MTTEVDPKKRKSALGLGLFRFFHRPETRAVITSRGSVEIDPRDLLRSDRVRTFLHSSHRAEGSPRSEEHEESR